MRESLDYRAMGERVRQRRREIGLTQEQLAEMAGVSNSFIGHIERGEKKASAETITAICESLDTSADYLLRGKRNLCNQQRCGLYEEMKALFSRYGS